MTSTVPAIAVATVAAVVLSALYYGLLGSRLARWSDAYAGEQRSVAAVLLVEVVRTAVVAIVVGWLVATATEGLPDALGLGLALWVAFPLVLLVGSVVHERVPVPLAAVHAGD